MQEYMQIVSTIGFPIAMCFYLALKFEKTLKENTAVTQELKWEIHNMKK